MSSFIAPPGVTPASLAAALAIRVPVTALGDGSDGAAVLDGVAAVAWAVLTGGNTYTMTRSCQLTSLTVNPGITLVPLYAVFCQGKVTNNGTASFGRSAFGAALDGGNGGGGGGVGAGGAFPTAVNTVPIASGVGAGYFGEFGPIAGQSGGGGTVGAGISPSVVTGSTFGNTAAAAGGAGGAGAGGAGAAPGGVPPRGRGLPGFALAAAFASLPGGLSTMLSALGGGGGGGGGDGTNKGGGGGGGGSSAAGCGIFCDTLDNTNGIFLAEGGNGGTGGTPTPISGNAGGGGGGAGGSGGILQVAARQIVSWGTRTLPGGAGGAGGGHTGTGANGAAGANGPAGYTIWWNLATGAVSLP